MKGGNNWKGFVDSLSLRKGSDPYQPLAGIVFNTYLCKQHYYA